MLKPVTNSQWKVNISTIASDLYFTSFSGIKDQAQTSTYADGTTGRIYQVKGPRQLQQFTLSIPFDPENPSMQALIAHWQTKPCEAVNILVTPVACGDQGEARGQTININSAQMISLSYAQVDRTSSNVSMLELGFIADDFFES